MNDLVKHFTENENNRKSNYKRLCNFILFTLSLSLVLSCSQTPKEVSLMFPEEIPAVAFAVGKIEHSLEKIGISINEKSDFVIKLQIDSNSLKEQEYIIKSEGNGFLIEGGGIRGLMYGGLELAEQIRLKQSLKIEDSKGSPYIEKRGLKFNIPLDARTPSYSDKGHSAQFNIAEMWNEDFWVEYLDNMALNRYNALTLWNPHPFPVMTKIPGYEDLALDDVKVTTLDVVKENNKFGPIMAVSNDVLQNLKTVKTISIDEKIEFWRNVFAHARNRGIDVYFITWNICPNSVALPTEPGVKTWDIKRQNDQAKGKYGINYQIENPQTLKYYQAAVKAFLKTYPGLKGIGVTAGERMPEDDEPEANYTRVRWLWEAYGLPMLEIMKEQPDREIDMIHRVWYSGMKEMNTYWKDYPGTFEISFKYARARLYSSPDIPFADEFVEEIREMGLKSWWNLRNDDIFIHRWGDPGYVREFIKKMPHDVTAGFHMGSDGYVWGRDFITKNASKPADLEITKHWYRFMLWGRLGYNPDLSDEFFTSVLKDKFPETDAKDLFVAWKHVSQILPTVNRFHFLSWDYMWAVEGCKGSNYHTVEDFYDNPTMERSGIINPKQYAEAKLKKEEISAITPLDIALQLDEAADIGLKHVQKAGKPKNSDLDFTLHDIKSMALLGKFYAQKIRASVSYAFYKQTNDQTYKNEAASHLKSGLEFIKAYSAHNKEKYKSQFLARTGLLDWDQLIEFAEDEIQMVLEK
jgi:hypothetical protein